MQITENAKKVLENRILRKDEEGNVIETPEEMVRRVTGTVARNEKEFADFNLVMDNLYFLPNSPCLANAGTNMPQLQACFVLPIEDSMESIFGTLADMATVFKCLPEGVKILTNKGLKNVENIKPGDCVIDRNGKFNKVLELIPSGEQDVYEAITRKGVSVRSTLEHKFLVAQNVRKKGFLPTQKTSLTFKPLKDICQKDGVIFANINEIPGETQYTKWSYNSPSDPSKGHFLPKKVKIPEVICEKTAWLLGYFIGNGSYHQDGLRFHINTRDYPQLRDKIVDTIISLFEIKPTFEKKGTSRETIYSHSVELRLFFKKIIGESKHCIPSCIFLSEPPVRWGFLSGLIDADGFVNDRGHLCVSTSSNNLYQDIVGLFNSLGIHVGVTRLLENSHYNTAYQIKPVTVEGYEKCKTNLTLFNEFRARRLKENLPGQCGIGYFEGYAFTKLREKRYIGRRKTYNLSVENIHEYMVNQLISKNSGGGVGFSLSRLRPKGDTVKSTGGQSSGPVSFLEPYNSTINAVKQGGRRRGAGLACVRVDHPDILEFIECKKDNDKFNNFNLSVLATDKFMEAVKNDGMFDLINPRNGEVAETVRAGDIWDKIVNGAHRNGDPCILFIDEVNRHNPTPELGDLESPNACAEFWGYPYESCNLGSINLTKIVTSDKEINWDLLEKVARIATRFLDNILDVTEYPLPQIKEMSLGNRKIGLGVMGWGDMLFKLGIPYNSQKALDLAWKVMGVVDEEAFMASHVIAEEKGVFPNWHKSPSFQEKYGKVRNASRTCIAPTGTLSIIANCTSGIEPAYGLVYEKHVLDGQTLYEVNPVFEQELKNRGIYSKGLLQKIADNNGSCQGIKEIPEDMQEVFVVAHDISPEWHVKMQAAFQKQTGMGISKTCNLPHDATKKDVEDALMLAYESGCKGVTVYRDGSREEQVLTAGKKAKPRKEVKVEVRERPTETSGVTTALKTGCGKLYCTVNEDEEGVCEIFLNQKEGNGCRVAYNNALAMVSSMALRAGVPIKDISKVLKGQSCGKPVWDNGKLILSCPDAIGKLLSSEQHQEFKENLESLENPEKSVKPVKTCPLCGGQIISQGGCEICHDCGDSRCGG